MIKHKEVIEMKIKGKVTQFIKKEDTKNYLLPEYTRGKNVMVISPEDYPYPFTISNFFQRVLRRRSFFNVLTNNDYKEGDIIEIDVKEHYETTEFKEEIYDEIKRQ